MNANQLYVTVNARIVVNDVNVPLWRVRILGRVAALLGISLDLETESPRIDRNWRRA